MTQNEWGLPDWHSEAAYGNWNDWLVDRWRWEFLRRRTDLRAFFDRHAAAIYQDHLATIEKIVEIGGMVSPHLLLRPDEPGFVVDGFRNSDGISWSPIDYQGNRVDQFGRFGYLFGVPNPKISNQPERTILGFSGSVVVAGIGMGTQLIYGECATLQILEGEIGVAINLDKPLMPQLKAAETLLRERQRERHGKLLQSRNHRLKWLTYLRVLDGRECGGTWAEIAEILTQTAGTPQTASDVWDQAHALCFNF